MNARAFIARLAEEQTSWSLTTGSLTSRVAQCLQWIDTRMGAAWSRTFALTDRQGHGAGAEILIAIGAGRDLDPAAVRVSLRLKGKIPDLPSGWRSPGTAFSHSLLHRMTAFSAFPI
jgi:hypothetical protein